MRAVVMRPSGPQTIGYSNDHPGGYGEYTRLTEALLLPVPPGLPTEHAALTEPMAVGLHAANTAALQPDDAPLVIGCGPVGLAVIGALRLRNVRPAVVFECVGVPGLLDQLMAASPRGTRLVVVGVCMEADTIHPMLGISKELSLQFVLGYTQEELAGVAGAFEALGSPDEHAKILVRP